MATSAAQIAKTGKYGDLRRRLVFLLLALVVYRVGAHIPVPGINPDQLDHVVHASQAEAAHRGDVPGLAARRAPDQLHFDFLVRHGPP